MRAIALVFALFAMLAPVPSSAQAIGTFTWQLEPYCNVVAFTVTPDGAAYRLTGYDDQCGAGTMPAAGVVTPNADGTFTLAFYLITPSGRAGHTTAILAPGAYSGPWQDDGGLTGTLRFALTGSSGGAVRPVPEFQRRVTGGCPAGEFVQTVGADGSVQCGAATGTGGGDITSVTAGTGLAGGGVTGDVTLAIATGGVGTTQITDNSITAADIDPSQIQRRVTGGCPADQFVQSVGADGSVQCAAAAPGDITAVTAGTGLTGGGVTGDVTLGIAAGGVGSAQIANGSIGAVDVDASQVQRRVFATCGSGTYYSEVGVTGIATCSHGSSAANVALGLGALAANTVGNFNTAVGYDALTSNTTEWYNSALGARALRDNSGGWSNVAVGYEAMTLNTTGDNNVAVGRDALRFNTSGGSNVAVGWGALRSSTTTTHNVGVGVSALYSATGTGNVAVGANAGDSMTTGGSNTALGYQALADVTTGTRNIGIGLLAGEDITTGSDNIYIGSSGRAFNESNTIRIGFLQGRAFIDGIRGVTTDGANAVGVLIDSAGQLGTVNSSRRVKEDVYDMGAASAAIFRLRPVTFRYVQSYADGSKPRDYGLIAEEVAEIYPDLVVRNEAGEVETVQYHKLVPMLLNEVQRLRRDLDEQRSTIEALRTRPEQRIHGK